MEDAQGRARAAAAFDLSAEERGDPRPGVRFVAVRSTADPSLALRFHPRLTVVTGFGDRGPRLVAEALRLARGGDTSGIAELDGALVPLARLPAAVAAAPPRIVGAAELRAAFARLTGATRDRLDDEIDAMAELVIGVEARCMEASGRIETIESGIRALEQGIAELAARRGEAGCDAGERPEGPDALEALLVAAEEAAALPKIVDPEAEQLAREWETLEASSAVRRAHSEIAAELRSCEDVTRAARERLIHLRTADREAEPAELFEAIRLRKAWTEARARTATRFAGARRREAADRARAAYDAHLRRYGVSTVEELAGSGTKRGTRDDDPEIQEAAAALAAAERRCEELRWLMRAPDDEREATRIVMRARARRILGREPGRDLAAALRAHRLDPREHVQAQIALAAALRAEQVRIDTTLEAAARDWIASLHAEQEAWERRQAELRRLDAELAHRRAELTEARSAHVDAGRELERLTAELEDLRFELRRLEARRAEHEHLDPIADLDEITPTQIPHLLHLAAGLDRPPTAHRPVVFDDPFADVHPAARRHVMSGLLSLAGRVQVVVFTDDAQTVAWARRAGDDFALVWSPATLHDERALRRPVGPTGR